MKRLIILLSILFFAVGLSAQSSAYNKTIYRDYGTFKVNDDGNVVSVSAFVTIQEEADVIHEDEMIQKKMMKEQKSLTPKTMFHYELYMVSKSVFEGDTTNTWLYGTRIFVNGVDALEDQSPNGFVVSVRTEPTLIYTYHSDSKDVKFNVKWDKAIYEPRIRK